MKLKLLTFFAVPLLGIGLFLLLPSFSLDNVPEETDPLQRVSDCCECCSPNSTKQGDNDCSWMEDWDRCNTLNEMIIDELWRMQSTKIPVLKGSSGSHNEPPKERILSNPLFQIPSDKNIEILTGVAITAATKSFAIGGKLNDVKISMEFIDAKGKTISKIGQKPMASVAMDKKTTKITQKVMNRSGFASIGLNEVGYFKAKPNFGGYEVKGIQTGAMLVTVFAKDKFGKFQNISTVKTQVRYADPVSFKKLINK